MQGRKTSTNWTTEPLADGMGIAGSVLLAWFWQGVVVRGKMPLAVNAMAAMTMIVLHPTVIYSPLLTLGSLKLDIYMEASFPCFLRQPKGRTDICRNTHFSFPALLRDCSRILSSTLRFVSGLAQRELSTPAMSP